MTSNTGRTAGVRTHASGHKVGRASDANPRGHNTGDQETRQAPAGDLAPYLKDDLIWIGGRHVCAVRGGVLRRVFDEKRELLGRHIAQIQ